MCRLPRKSELQSADSKQLAHGSVWRGAECGSVILREHAGDAWGAGRTLESAVPDGWVEGPSVDQSGQGSHGLGSWPVLAACVAF